MSEHDELREAIARIERKVDRLEEKSGVIEERIEMLLASKPVKQKDTLKVSDIAILKGRTPAHLRRCEPWLLPQNGVSQFSGRPARWKVDRYLEWEKTPEDVRRTAYLTNR